MDPKWSATAANSQKEKQPDIMCFPNNTCRVTLSKKANQDDIKLLDTNTN